MNITECLVCKSKNIIKLTDDKKAFGLVEIKAPNCVNINTLLPVHAFCCKDCGFVFLQHVQPDSIKKN